MYREPEERGSVNEKACSTGLMVTRTDVYLVGDAKVGPEGLVGSRSGVHRATDLERRG